MTPLETSEQSDNLTCDIDRGDRYLFPWRLRSDVKSFFCVPSHGLEELPNRPLRDPREYFHRSDFQRIASRTVTFGWSTTILTHLTRSSSAGESTNNMVTSDAKSVWLCSPHSSFNSEKIKLWVNRFVWWKSEGDLCRDKRTHKRCFRQNNLRKFSTSANTQFNFPSFFLRNFSSSSPQLSLSFSLSLVPPLSLSHPFISETLAQLRFRLFRRMLLIWGLLTKNGRIPW